MIFFLMYSTALPCYDFTLEWWCSWTFICNQRMISSPSYRKQPNLTQQKLAYSSLS